MSDPLCTDDICRPAALRDEARPLPATGDSEVIYVGDPMCSWCWGISPALSALRQSCEASGLPFRIMAGGLRPGGGDPWTEQFRDFLRRHWREVAVRSGQPFSEALLERARYNYDTEPACRGFVAARALIGADPFAARQWDFFVAIQQRFYVESADPAEVSFYAPVCAAQGLDFAAFSAAFASAAARAETQRDFHVNRAWGVTGYPAVLYRQGQQLFALASGYATFAAMRDRLRAAAAPR